MVASKYVYGVVPLDAASSVSGSGIDGEPLDTIAGATAAALVSDVAGAELSVGREHLRVHAQVLERALEHGSVLPMRFGVVMEGEEAVRRELLERHATELAAQLGELGGKLELRVRGTYDEGALMAEIVAGSPQVAQLREQLRGQPADATYFERIRLGELVSAEVERRRERDSEQAVAVLSPFSEDLRLGEPAHERVALDASFLVALTAREDFEEALEGLAEAQAGRLTFKLVGPLPPYSFVASFAGEGQAWDS